MQSAVQGPCLPSFFPVGSPDSSYQSWKWMGHPPGIDRRVPERPTQGGLSYFAHFCTKSPLGCPPHPAKEAVSRSFRHGVSKVTEAPKA